MVENAEIVRMTGAELKQIWDASKLDDDQIKPIFGFSRSTLYNRFEDEKIPIAVETAVDGHEVLSEWKNRIYSRVPMDNRTEQGNDFNKYLIETAALMRDFMGEMKQMNKTIDKAVLGLTDDNKYYREENSKLLTALLSK